MERSRPWLGKLARFSLSFVLGNASLPSKALPRTILRFSEIALHEPLQKLEINIAIARTGNKLHGRNVSAN